MEYVDLDGETGQEILIGRQLTDQVLQSVSAYALENGEIVELMTASYSQFTTCDLDNGGRICLCCASTQRRAAVRQSCTGTGTIRCSADPRFRWRTTLRLSSGS